MNYTVESSRVILPLEGRITSDNAPELMRRLQEILDANPSLEPVFDLDKTEYMSSGQNYPPGLPPVSLYHSHDGSPGQPAGAGPDPTRWSIFPKSFPASVP